MGQTPPGGIPQEEIVRQFVPHSCVTSVLQGDPPDDDVVSCIFLVPGGGGSSSASECPLYVNSYRCDSAETADLLRQQLQAMVDRPENRAKYDEIEARLVEKGLLPPNPHGSKVKQLFNRTGSASSSSKMGSDGRSLGRSSDSSSDLGGNNKSSAATQDKLVSLHESLAAELREKLKPVKGGTSAAVVAGGGVQERHAPLLLPPKDYDTMHRNRGDLRSAGERRALNPALVGGAAANGSADKATKGVGTSDGSSGIGSDGGGGAGNNTGDTSPVGSSSPKERQQKAPASGRKILPTVQ